ncbi:mersacidin family lantibiotic, partial [Bacillus cereus group sp. MYBK108-2]|nr:mersacidin family lantibiotic [Bacillus cereus]HEC4820961.1 mersacidin family lantibiotic [Bacillus cereus]
AEIQGASDVQPETTPLCVGVIIGLTTSIKICK